MKRKDDGSLVLVPAELVTSDVLALAKDAKAEILELVSILPRAGHCPICGDPNSWLDLNGSITAHCVDCAQIAADRLLASLGVESPTPLTLEVFHALAS